MTEEIMSPEAFKQLYADKTDEEILTTVKENEEA